MNRYIEKVRKKIGEIFPKREEEQSEEEYRKVLMIRGVEAIVFLFAALAIVRGAISVLPASVTVSSSVNGRALPIYSVETEKKQIALSFDAAWGNGDTARILEILKKNNIYSTFFMTGGWVEAYPEDVKAILAAGHDLGNHSDNHKNMSQLSEQQCKEEILEVHRKVQELTGYEMFLFRPPYGDYNNRVINAASECGYYAIQWNLDSLDWKDYGVNAILDRVLNSEQLENGSIVLCHNGAKFTADALESLIKGLQDKGFEIVPVSELIYRNAYHMDAEGRQIRN
ncbi:polysaccharide deacetylase family protein [Kineothrix sp. MB12-C1]|uniref:polysaccharide deacetylase family protein n=1 Tax=Kineothrix sp. MB12-C1 TaxID=3070215 RepID=UPI0027D27E7E|nr:polysaccharide deacetylase family protein [Kineothrix sp. MB12-C1]WMC91801.1 polysaccharide deacetylase family protein [Kineothrix sp. MB12-C1]